MANDLWEDDHEQIKYGNFYAGFRSEWAYFFVVCHAVNDIGLGGLGVFLAVSPSIMNIITASILTAYMAAIAFCRPYAEKFDLLLDIGNLVISIAATGLSEHVTVLEAAGEELGTFVLVCLYSSLVLMVVLSLNCLWPIVQLAQLWLLPEPEGDVDTLSKAFRVRRDSLSVVLLHERSHLHKMEMVIGTALQVNQFAANLKATVTARRRTQVRP